VPTLSGDVLYLNFNEEVIRPNTVRKIPGRGMPQPKDPTKCGELVVSFEIIFPERLPSQTKEILKNCLPNK
jgi:DnaJ-class molecular chaperone